MTAEVTRQPVAFTGVQTRRAVQPTAILRWLAAGWSDLKGAPVPSLAIGAACAAFGWALLLVTFALNLPIVTVPLTAAFVLVAPVLVIGLYESSRRQALGEPVTLGCTLAALRRNPQPILEIAALLALLLVAWLMIAWLMLALLAVLAIFAGSAPFPFAQRSAALIAENWDICVLAVGLGTVLAEAGFCVSAVSLPMLVSEDVNASTAVAASLRACRDNPVTMAFWAVTLLLLCFLAAAPAFSGLIVLVPVLGHASWHAYRELAQAERS